MSNDMSSYESRYFTDEDINSIIALKRTCSVFSLIGSLVIVIIYSIFKFKFKEYFKEKKTQRFFSRNLSEDKIKFKGYKIGVIHDLIMISALFNILESLSSFIELKHTSGFIETDHNCISQAIISSFSEMVKLMAVSLLSFLLIMAICGVEVTKTPNYFVYFVIYLLVIPLLFVIGPGLTHSLGPSGAWCWIKIDKVSNKFSMGWSGGVYVLNWLHIIFNVVSVALSRNEFDFKSKPQLRHLEEAITPLRVFPIILVVCWIPASVNRIYSLIYWRDSIYLSYIHVVFFSCQGAVSAIAYALIYKQNIRQMRIGIIELDKFVLDVNGITQIGGNGGQLAETNRDVVELQSVTERDKSKVTEKYAEVSRTERGGSSKSLDFSVEPEEDNKYYYD